MKNLPRVIVAVGLLLAVEPTITRGDGPASTRPAMAATSKSAPKVDPNRLLTDQIRQGDAGQIDDAVTKIKAALENDGTKALLPLRSTWLKSLFDTKRFGDVAELAQKGTLLAPGDTVSLEFFQSMRVQALLEQGKNAEALVEAKRLFNIAGMKGTSDAMLMVCQCLNAVSPNDREVLKRFRQEQVDAAQIATQPASPRTSTLGKIVLESKPYEASAKILIAEDYRTLVARGDLLLLAGMTQDARDAFERAYTLAADHDLPAATENLARCMKAEDGAIGRANAWILSIRPKASAATQQESRK